MKEQSPITQGALAMIGRQIGPGEPFRVESEVVRRFAEAIQEDFALFLGRGSGEGGTPGQLEAPLTFPLYNCNSGIDRDFDIPLKAPRRIRGGDEFRFLAPIQEGDRIKAKTTLLDIYEREGATGRMVFIVTETVYTNQREEAVMINRATIIRR